MIDDLLTRAEELAARLVECETKTLLFRLVARCRVLEGPKKHRYGCPYDNEIFGNEEWNDQPCSCVLSYFPFPPVSDDESKETPMTDEPVKNEDGRPQRPVATPTRPEPRCSEERDPWGNAESRVRTFGHETNNQRGAEVAIDLFRVAHLNEISALNTEIERLEWENRHHKKMIAMLRNNIKTIHATTADERVKRSNTESILADVDRDRDQLRDDLKRLTISRDGLMGDLDNLERTFTMLFKCINQEVNDVLDRNSAKTMPEQEENE